LENDLEAESEADASSILQFYQGLQELIEDEDTKFCAEAYAETITYGLFLASINSGGDLDRETASNHIPQRIGVIKRIFTNISGDSLPSNVAWIVEEIIEVLNAADTEEILGDMDGRGKKDRDPFTYFYEDFLSHYDPEKRKQRGVYYTPRPVVSFIINSMNHILKSEFDKALGFADDEVTLLDPAVGTGTFLRLVYLLALQELKENGRSGLISDKIENHIKPNNS